MTISPAQMEESSPSRTPDHTFRSGRRIAQEAVGAQAQIDNLARAGVVTHMVGHGEEIDTLFAVSQLRDLPRVRFVAAFREGVIALGCPDGLPAQLEGLAAPVTAPPADQQKGPPPADVADKLDQLLEHVSALAGPDGLAGLTERVNALDTMGSETARMVAELAQTTSDTEQAGASETAHLDLMAPIESLVIGQKELSDQVTGPMTEIAAQLADLQQQMAAATAMSSAQQDHAPVWPTEVTQGLEALPDIRAALVRLEDALTLASADGNSRLDRMQTHLERIEVAQTADRTEEGAALQRVEALVQSLPDTLSQILTAQETDPLAAQILPRLDAIATQLDAALAETAAPVDQPIEAHEQAERTAVLAALTQLQDAIGNLAARPDPVLDLTAQRQSFAQFSTVLNMIVQRLEGAADHVKAAVDRATEAPDAARLEEDHDALVTKLKEAVSAVIPTQEEGAGLQDVVSGLETLPTIAAQVAQAHAGVETLLNRPKPVLDLTEQRRSFAAFTTALATVVQRLESAADKHDEIPPSEMAETAEHQSLMQLPELVLERVSAALDTAALAAQISENLAAQAPAAASHADLQRLEDAIGHLPVQVTSALAIPDLAPIEAEVGKLGQMHSDLPASLSRLEDRINAISAVPPVLDLTEQRASFAMFSTALASVINRLEHAVSRVDAAGQEDDDQLLAQVSALRDHIAASAPDLTEVTTALSGLSPLTALPDQLAQVQAVLAEGLGTLHVRLPQSQDGSLDDALRPLLKRMRRMERNVASLLSGQEEAGMVLEALITAFEEEAEEDHPAGEHPMAEEEDGTTTDAPFVDVADVAPLPSGDAPLHHLRYHFAEMIASQMRQTVEGRPINQMSV